MFQSFIAIAIAAAIGFILTFFFWKDDTVVEESSLENKSEKTMKEIISSPVKGNVLPLSKASDQAFAQGALGKGVLIEPIEGIVRAPFDGTVMTLFPTKHAIGLISDQGMELLVHIGMDTVQLEGKGFEANVSQGDKVKKGQILVTFDIEAIKSAGYSVETPIIITNTGDYLDIIETTNHSVTSEDMLITALA